MANIVNVSSISGLMAYRNDLSYCMSEAALDQFTKCSALDLAPKGIRLNSINPAAIRTNIFEQWGLTWEQYNEMVKNRCPIGRTGDVANTSAAIAYLADHKTTPFLTGVLLSVDGGCLVVGT